METVIGRHAVSSHAARGARIRSARIPFLAVLVLLISSLAISSHLVAPRAAWADTGSREASGDSGSQAAEGSAYAGGAPFAINGFIRNNKGTARPVDGRDLGYRYPLDGDASLVVVNAPSSIIVYVSPKAASQAGFDMDSDASRAALRSMVVQLDEEQSMGGELLADADKPWAYTTSPTYELAGFTYAFNVEVGSDRYTSVKLTDAASGGGATEAKQGTLWSDSASLVPRADVVTERVKGPVEQLGDFLAGIDYRPLWVSVKTSGAALAVVFVLGLLAAWRTVGTSSRLKGVLDSIFTVPMVLPPTVCGFLLLLMFGRSTALGRWFVEHGLSLVFTWPAAVISAVVVSFPLMYRTALGAFEALDPQMLDAARTLGWGEGRIFRRLMLPLAWPSIAAGTVLAFARAMGEFGCTLFFAGNYAGITQTIPIAIYFEWMGGDTPVAIFWVVVVIAFSFLVILVINLYTARSQRYRSRGLTRAERRQLAAAEASRAAGTASAAELRELSSDSLAADTGDALRIDRDALRELMGEGGR